MSGPQPLVGTNRRTIIRVLGSSAASQGAGAFVNLVVLPVVLHGIGPVKYGEWATIAAVVAIGQLVQAAVGTDIARRVATAHGQGDVDAGRSAVRQGVTVLAGLGALVELVTVVFGRRIVDVIFATIKPHAQGQLFLLLVGVVSVFVAGLVGNGYFSVLQGLQRADFAAWSSVASVFVSAAVTIVGIAMGLGLWALLVAAVSQQLVSWVGPIIGVRRLVPGLKFRFTRVSRQVLFGFIGMPAMLVAASASDLFDSQVDKLVLAHTVGPSASGMFQIGVGLEQALRSVAVVPLGVMLAGTAELFKTDPTRLRRLETLSDTSTQALASVGAGGLILFAVPFISVWLGPGYHKAAVSVQFLAVAALFNMWSAPWTYYAIGRRRYHYVLIAATVTLAVNALSTVLLTSRIGLMGALIGSVAGSAAGTVVGRVVLARWEKRAWLRPAFRASGLIAVVVLVLFAGRSLVSATWPSLSLWAAVYVVACGLVLAFTGSLPVRLSLKRGRPRLELRGQAAPAATEPP